MFYIKLLKQEKGYSAKKFIAKIPIKPYTLIRLLDSSRFGVTSHKPL